MRTPLSLGHSNIQLIHGHSHLLLRHTLSDYHQFDPELRGNYESIDPDVYMLWGLP